MGELRVVPLGSGLTYHFPRGGSMGSEKNEHGVVTAMKSDHNAAERSVKALLNAFKEKNPVAVLIGDRYRGFPFRLQTENQEYRFIVLGWYAITHAWGTCIPLFFQHLATSTH
jgi:hypothetical protein